MQADKWQHLGFEGFWGGSQARLVAFESQMMMQILRHQEALEDGCWEAIAPPIQVTQQQEPPSPGLRDS